MTSDRPRAALRTVGIVAPRGRPLLASPVTADIERIADPSTPTRLGGSPLIVMTPVELAAS
jgi:hypothetical protein